MAPDVHTDKSTSHLNNNPVVSPPPPPQPFPPQSTPPPPPPSPVAERVESTPEPIKQSETVVMPQTFGQEAVASSTPQTFTLPQDQPQPVNGQVGKKGSGCFGKIIIFILILLIIGSGVFGSKFFLKYLEDSKQVEITYWGLWENPSVLKQVIADFEKKNPKIKVNYQMEMPKEYRKRLTSYINQGKGPDVFRFHNTWVPMLKNVLNPVPSTIMTTSQFSTAFYPVAVNDLVATNTIYGIPLMIDGLGLYINEDLFAAAGVVPPTTWEDIIKVGGLVEKLTVKNDQTIITSAIAMGSTKNVENFSDIVALLMLQNDVDLRNPSGKLAEDTLSFYKSFSNPSDPMYTWNDTLDNSVYAFAMGKVAMILAPSWRVFDIKQINSETRFKIVPVPQLPCVSGSPCKPVSWASYWVEGVSEKSKYQKQAWEFVKYLTSRETAVRLYSSESVSSTRPFGEPYALMELAKTIENDPYAGAYVTQAKIAQSFPLASRTLDEGLNDQMIKYLEDGLNSIQAGGSAKEAIDSTIAPGFAQVLSQAGLVSSVPNTSSQ